MKEETREERNERNRKLLGLTPDNLEEHVQRDQARQMGVEQFQKLKADPPAQSMTMSQEEADQVDSLMDQIIEISGAGGVFILQPHEAPIIENLAAGRGLAPVQWIGEAIRHLMNLEEGVYRNGGLPTTFTATLPEQPAETPRPKK